MTRISGAGLRGLALAVLAATASTAALADADARLRVFGYSRAAPVDTVPDSVIDDWKYLDDGNVMVFRNSQAYLLVLSGSCPALQTAGVIGFNAALSGLVAAKTLVVGGRSTQTECGVSQIVQLQRAGGPPVMTPAPRPRPMSPPPAAAAPPPPVMQAPAPSEVAPPPPAAAPMYPAAPPSTPPSPPPPRIDHEVKPPPGATPL